MNKINFQDLPDTTTPLNANNMNQLQTNIEDAIDGIIETVEGTNATAVKYADGTLVQYGVLPKTGFMTTTSASSTVQGINWYRSEVGSITFPVSFLSGSTYSINFTPRSTSSGARVYIPRITGTKTNSACLVQLIGVEDFLETSPGYMRLTEVDWQAIGKWK